MMAFPVTAGQGVCHRAVGEAFVTYHAEPWTVPSTHSLLAPGL